MIDIPNRAARRAAQKKHVGGDKKKTARTTQLTCRVIVEGKAFEAPVFMRRWLETGAEAYRAERELGLTQTFEDYLETMSRRPENASAIARQA